MFFFNYAHNATSSAPDLWSVYALALFLDLLEYNDDLKIF